VFSVRIHGRGGQGVVTAAELLSAAASASGLEAQAFPSFGSERMGAPVVSFCRIDSHRIRLREPIAEPDAVVVQDATLLHHVDLFGGLAADGFAVINSARTVQQLGLAELLTRHPPERVATVPASDIARAALGRPIPNAALLGALGALTGLIRLAALERAIRARFSGSAAEGNAAAARSAYGLLSGRVHVAAAAAPPEVVQVGRPGGGARAGEVAGG
jgi:pyruvate ferredoxin oxidoreductase gamma subunit